MIYNESEIKKTIEADISASKSTDPIGNKQKEESKLASEIQEGYEFSDKVEFQLVKMLANFNKQLGEEDVMRADIVSFLEAILIAVALIPIILISILTAFGKVNNPVALITAVVAMPIEIIGVFGIISKNLFADTYRTSLPEMISKYLISYKRK